MRHLLKQVAQPRNKSIRHISLTQGQVAIVDAADYEWLSQWSWYATWDKTIGGYYAHRAEYAGHGSLRKVTIAMHRFILGLKRGDRTKVDHKNANTLDNRRSNIRKCNRYQSAQNRKMHKHNMQGYKGVNWNGSNKWRVYIGVRGKKVYMGSYETKKEAARVYNEAAIKYHGEFARLNHI